LKVLFFGQLRDIAGRSEDSLELVGPASLEDVFEQYAGRFPRLRDLRHSTVIACNQQFAEATTIVNEGDEIAFLPPVSGGADQRDRTWTQRWTHEIQDDAGNFFALTRQPIDTLPIRSRLLAGTDGAVVDFVGVVRNNTKGRPTRFLDYECYEGMAVKMMAEIGISIAASHPIGRIAMVHRLGRMEIGETSVAIIVTAPHRRPAFEAALEGINRLKKLVPIWKKEHFEDGEVWVDGEWDESVLRR